MSLLNRRQQIAIKTEATEGTMETALVAADAGFNVFESSFSPDIQQFERSPFRSSIGSLASIAGMRQASLSFTTELIGSNVVETAPPFGTILKMCGFREFSGLKTIPIGAVTVASFVPGEVLNGDGSGVGVCVKSVANGETMYLTESSAFASSEVITGATSGAVATTSGTSAATGGQGVYYRPTSEFNDSGETDYLSSATVWIYNDGLLHKLNGCRGNFTLKAEVGQPMMMDIELTGGLNITTDATMLTGITYPTITPPTFMGTNILSVHGSNAVFVNSLEMTSGNDLQYRSDPNTSAGLISSKIVGRAAGGSMDPEGNTIAGGIDWFNSLYDNTEGVLDLTIGSAPKNKFLISANKAQFSSVGGGERSGLTTNQVELSFNETNGNDELVILAL
jgi:hypothetical protein